LYVCSPVLIGSGGETGVPAFSRYEAYVRIVADDPHGLDRTGDAVRALKRRIARAVYQQLKLAEQRLRTAPPAAA
jgi:hypothetical protein